MRRRQPELEILDIDGIPVELRAGRCIEVWADDKPKPFMEDRPRWRAVSAFTNYSKARARYLLALGFGPRDQAPKELHWNAGAPWSFDFLAEHDPGRLADILHQRGLPPDWQPSRARPLDFFGPER